jgi:hypothetical protein
MRLRSWYPQTLALVFLTSFSISCSTLPAREWPVPDAVAALEAAGFECRFEPQDREDEDGRFVLQALYVCRRSSDGPTWQLAHGHSLASLRGDIAACPLSARKDGPPRLHRDEQGRVDCHGSEELVDAVRRILR